MRENSKEKKEKPWPKEQLEKNVKDVKSWPSWMKEAAKIRTIEIKKPLQALLISPDPKVRFDILNGKKNNDHPAGLSKIFCRASNALLSY